MTDQLSSKVEQPYWDRIIEDCKNKIIEKHAEYSNSWCIDMPSNEFWKKRLQGELDEVKELLIGSFHDELKLMKECVDVINLCAMIYSIEAKHYHEWVNSARHG